MGIEDMLKGAGDALRGIKDLEDEAKGLLEGGSKEQDDKSDDDDSNDDSDDDSEDDDSSGDSSN